MEIKYKDISYSQWTIKIKDIKENGLNDEKFESLINEYPRKLDVRSTGELFNQVAFLEKHLLNSAFRKFENCINEAIYENDIEIIEIAISRLMKNLSKCLFFKYMDCLSVDSKKRLQDDIYSNVSQFQNDIESFVKGASIECGGYFMQDVLYLLQKKNIKSSILEMGVL